TFAVIYLVMLGTMFLAWCAVTIGSWSPTAGLLAGISFITLYASTIAYHCSTHSSWYHRVMQRLEPKLHPHKHTLQHTRWQVGVECNRIRTRRELTHH